MDNAGDRKSIRAKEKASRLADITRAEQINSVMSTPQGREWIWSLLERAHIFTTSFAGDPYLTAFAEGERNQGQLLLNDIMTACPEQFILAMRENNERRTRNYDNPANRSAEAGNGAVGERSGSENPGRDDQGFEYDPTGYDTGA